VTLQDRKILVTGGSRGIGRAISLGLLERGVGGLAVAAEEERPPGLDALETRGAIYLRVDLGTEEEPGELVRGAAERLGGLDGLVHCAGVYPEADPGGRSEVDLWNETVNIKARGGYLLACEFSRAAGEGSSFVAVTSINAEQPEPGHLAYDPACAALGGVIRAFAIEHAPRIRFNSVAPGLIHTRLTEEVAASPDLKKHAEDNIPMQTMGQPEDCVGAVLFLLGEESSYITGETIFVDGGIRANQMSRPS
jgi:NAD(P)-dependent dehydrogenase (short-subunit alcohol dehydrogenase family)